MSWTLDAIIRYEMDDLQAKAFKLSLLWETLSQQQFPKLQHTRLRTTGDPRKSHLFRICYKLVRDTLGLIPDPEYKLYILAQLHVLKHISDLVSVDPQILTGERAWRRWKLWKRKYDSYIENQKITLKDTKTEINLQNIRIELEQTKTFLAQKLGSLTKEAISIAIKDHSFIKWVSMKRVSPYFVLLSPWVSEAIEGKQWDDVFLYDLSDYKMKINSDIEKLFKEIFNTIVRQ